MERIAEIERNTKETQIKLTLNLDGSGKYSVKNPIGFFNHMLWEWLLQKRLETAQEFFGQAILSTLWTKAF